MTTSYVLMYDGIHSDVPSIPTTAAKVAGYVSGAVHDYYWTAADWARFPHAAHLRIDTNGSVPLASDVVDCEQGDVTPTGAAIWARHRQDHGLGSWIYCSESALAAVRAACKANGVTRVAYWVAHWGLTVAQAAAKLGGDIVAVQFSSPSTHPGQKYDLSVAVPGWFPAPTPPVPPKPPIPVIDGILVPSTDKPGPWPARVVCSSDGGKTWV